MPNAVFRGLTEAARPLVGAARTSIAATVDGRDAVERLIDRPAKWQAPSFCLDDTGRIDEIDHTITSFPGRIRGFAGRDASFIEFW